jgi:hypothetical protein
MICGEPCPCGSPARDAFGLFGNIFLYCLLKMLGGDLDFKLHGVYAGFLV